MVICTTPRSILKVSLGSEAMDSWLRALADLPKEFSSIPRTHMTVTAICNTGSKKSDVLF